MKILHALALPLLGLGLLATPAAAQTTPARKATARKAAHSTDPMRATSSSDNNVYAAPGEPVLVRKNGKNTPPYDGPAAGHGTTPKGMALPPKQ